MPRTAIGDLEMNYRLDGDGPETVVLINGLADDLGTWASQVPACPSRLSGRTPDRGPEVR